MNAGTLLWRTPTGGMLWEIWGRHKMKFLCQGLILAANVFLVQWKEHGAPEPVRDLLVPGSCLCFLWGFLPFLVCFGYIEVEVRGVQVGFPGRLLLKPVGTARLALVPMLLGGAITVSVFAIWSELVWRHLVEFTASDLLVASAVLLSFFWWMQALAWGLPSLKGRMFIVASVALIHFMVWQMPRLPWGAALSWRWPILAALLVTAVPVAWFGLKLTRQGRWEGPTRFSTIWSHTRFARARTPRSEFGSAFRAQFWLEWRRQGLLLPGIAGGMTFLIFPLILKCFQWAGADAVPPEAILGILILPVVASTLLAPVLARFDRFHLAGELPVYIAVRPMTNGGFVVAKLAMALATSVLAWLVTVASACFWLALMEKDTLFSRDGFVTPYGLAPYLSGCVPAVLLLVLWTWKNLVSGIAAGLTGRSWIAVASVYWRLAFLAGLFPLIGTASTNANFKEALLRWLPGILIVCLAAKIAVSIAAFFLGLRRNAITRSAAGWMVGGWAVCGLFVAGCAAQVCYTIHKPGLWAWIAVAGFLILPLADLAIAPLALAWNRHR